MDEDVGKGKICHCIFINPAVEIIVISDEILAQSVVPVEHAGHSVKTKSVDVIFLHPEFAVGKKEILCLILTIVETARSPCRVPSLISLVEIQILASVESSEAFSLVIH